MRFARGSFLVWVGVLAAALAVAGCKSSPKQSDTQTSDTGSEFKEAPPPPEPQTGTARKVDLASVLQPVYFDFDRYNIRDDARPVLRSNASAINDHDEWGRVTVEGHCDERGSEEYNLALGERRANTVRQYLVDLGVPSTRLDTVSFGEAKPAVMGHDESAWRYNRRSEFTEVR